MTIRKKIEIMCYDLSFCNMKAVNSCIDKLINTTEIKIGFYDEYKETDSGIVDNLFVELRPIVIRWIEKYLPNAVFKYNFLITN
jgi:hypothetical protein